MQKALRKHTHTQLSLWIPSKSQCLREMKAWKWSYLQWPLALRVLLRVHTDVFNEPPWRNLITVCILASLSLQDVLRRVTGRFCFKISRRHVGLERGREGGREGLREERKWWRKSLFHWLVYRGEIIEERKKSDWGKKEWLTVWGVKGWVMEKNEGVDAKMENLQKKKDAQRERWVIFT